MSSLYLLTGLIILLSVLVWKKMKRKSSDSTLGETNKTFSFRIRITRSPTDTIQCEERKISLPNLGLGSTLRLSNKEKDKSIKDAESLQLIGDGFSSQEEAFLAGQFFEDVLTVTLARVRIGVDFGSRAPKGFFTKAGLKMLEQEHGYRILNDEHGLMIYEADPIPKFILMNAKAQRGIPLASFEDVYVTTLNVEPKLNERERVAFILFNASFFQKMADTRFILLVMAIEAVIEPAARNDISQEHVESLIKLTNDSSIPNSEKASMVGTLSFMKKESISQAGKRLVEERLGKSDRQYLNLSAVKFFTKVYTMRSNLVHGNQPYPTFNEVSSIVGDLEVFVSDLLTTPIIGERIET